MGRRNNDVAFVRPDLHVPDLHVIVVDALPPQDARGYDPGEAVRGTLDIVVNEVNAALPNDRGGRSNWRER
jgi:predicted GTPase